MKDFEKALQLLFPIITTYKQLLGGADEPLDGDDVETLVALLRAIINLQEGNITEEEYKEQIKSNFITN